MLDLLYAATSTKSSSSSGSYLIILYIVVFGALYFFYIRPRSRRQKAARVDARRYEVGDEVQTVGGVIGRVTKIADGVVTVHTSTGIDLEFIASAVNRRPAPAPAPSESPAPATDTESGTSEGNAS